MRSFGILMLATQNVATICKCECRTNVARITHRVARTICEICADFQNHFAIFERSSLYSVMLKLRHLCTWTIPLIFLWTCKNVEWIINCIQFCWTNYNNKLKKRGLETHAKILSLAEVVMTLFRECGSPLFVFVSRINGTPACVNDLLSEIMLSFCVQDS